jgi:hypothetical protein
MLTLSFCGKWTINKMHLKKYKVFSTVINMMGNKTSRGKGEDRSGYSVLDTVARKVLTEKFKFASTGGEGGNHMSFFGKIFPRGIETAKTIKMV